MLYTPYTMPQLLQAVRNALAMRRTLPEPVEEGRCRRFPAKGRATGRRFC